MKYEMIFGDQSLFDKATRKNTVAIYKISENLTVEFDKYEELLAFLQQQPLCDRPDIAMRRIIPEPKRWTWEDKKAGRLPEVGCDIQYIESQKRVSVIAINSNEIVLLAKSNGSKFFVLDPDSLLQYYNPIETPAEKAQRERDEWCNKAAKQLKNLEYNSTLISIYDALKSGELPMPKKGGE